MPVTATSPSHVPAAAAPSLLQQLHQLEEEGQLPEPQASDHHRSCCHDAQQQEQQDQHSSQHQQDVTHLVNPAAGLLALLRGVLSNSSSGSSNDGSTGSSAATPTHPNHPTTPLEFAALLAEDITTAASSSSSNSTVVMAQQLFACLSRMAAAEVQKLEDRCNRWALRHCCLQGMR